MSRKIFFKYGIIISVLICSHTFFFFSVDQYRSELKQLTRDLGIWSPELFLALKGAALKPPKKPKKKKDLNEIVDTNFHMGTYENYDVEALLAAYSKDFEKESLGVITAAKLWADKSIDIVTANGFIVRFDAALKVIGAYRLESAIGDIYINDGHGGVRGAVWVKKNNLIVYTTILRNGKFGIELNSIAIVEPKLISVDRLYLEDLSTQIRDTYALGGGMTLHGDKLYLAIGMGNNTNQYEQAMRIQTQETYWGHSVEIEIDANADGYTLLKSAIPFTKGHRNPQGLAVIENQLLSVEHGPKGGDEVNILVRDGNYGWPEFSYGLPYDGQPTVVAQYERYKTSFIEPIHYFTPSIGISDISSCPFTGNAVGYDKCVLISSMRAESFYILKYKIEEGQLNVLSREPIYYGMRIRKIIGSDMNIYLFTDSLIISKISYTENFRVRSN